jgi:hypothetical protein
MQSLRLALSFLPALFVAMASPAFARTGVLSIFAAADHGGLVLTELGDEIRSKVVWTHPSLNAAHKLRVSETGRWATVNAEMESGENFFIFDLAAEGFTPSALSLNFIPEEHEIGPDDRVYVGGSGGNIVAVDLATGTVVHRWNSRRQLTPPGNKPEDLQVHAGSGLLVVSHQKDGAQGRKGNRVILLRLADLSLVADLPLPRNHPDLHISEREAGPSPELIRWDAGVDRVVISLDLYGALAIADLGAMLQGRWENLVYLPTAGDGSWGNSFPDRIQLVPHAGRVFVLASNASEQGGMTVFDIVTRERIAFYPMDAATDYAVIVNEGATVATLLSGKRKRRLGSAIENITTPGRDLILLDVAGMAQGSPAALRRIDLGAPVSRMGDVGGHPELVAVGLRDPNALILVDVNSGREVHRFALPGVAVNFARLGR